MGKFRFSMWPKVEDTHREYLDNTDRCEYFLPVKWLQTVPLEQAVKEVGLFRQSKHHLQTHFTKMARYGGTPEGEVS